MFSRTDRYDPRGTRSHRAAGLIRVPITVVVTASRACAVVGAAVAVPSFPVFAADIAVARVFARGRKAAISAAIPIAPVVTLANPAFEALAVGRHRVAPVIAVHVA